VGADGAVAQETGVLRLFVAAGVPEDVKRAVATAIEPWRQTFPNVRWIPPENWHITLKFLGGTERGSLPWIEETIRSVSSAHAPLESRLAHLGAFPSAGRARILWAGVDDPEDRLAAISSDLDAALETKFRVEVHRFHPHVTVARSEPPRRLPGGFAETSVSAGPFIVDRLVLFQSRLQRPRPRYEALRFFALGR
jgi:2'-5' RNA ligase